MQLPSDHADGGKEREEEDEEPVGELEKAASWPPDQCKTDSRFELNVRLRDAGLQVAAVCAGRSMPLFPIAGPT